MIVIRSILLNYFQDSETLKGYIPSSRILYLISIVQKLSFLNHVSSLRYSFNLTQNNVILHRRITCLDLRISRSNHATFRNNDSFREQCWSSPKHFIFPSFLDGSARFSRWKRGDVAAPERWREFTRRKSRNLRGTRKIYRFNFRDI